MSSEERGSSLEQRVSRLEDVLAIQTLKYQYAAYCDSGYDLDGLCSIFVPDGRWVAKGYGDYVGHAQIRDYFAELSKTVADVLHYVTSPRIQIADDSQSATGRFYLLCLCKQRRREDPAVTYPVIIVGTYDDQFVKSDGRWLFRELRVDVRFASRIRSSVPG
jgi:hypothetical protein